MAINFNEYIESKRLAATKKKIPQEIKERWNTRVVRRSLQTLGRSGAIQYLNDYGKGIAAPKAILLALVAESEGYPEMATIFWAKAFELETGEKAFDKEHQEGAFTHISHQVVEVGALKVGKSSLSKGYSHFVQ